ncbi:MAG: rhodanese-like domain-containing protein, partial [Pseudomonadota bacterium]
MSYAHPESLVSTEWLAQRLDAPDLRIVDATYYLPIQGKDAYSEYLDRHIPGAVFFDIDEIASKETDLPHMLPSPEKFASAVRTLGLGDGNRIVVYDAHGMMSAARVWWTFRVFGHEDVAVLDGGLPKWLAEGRPVE